MFSKMLIFIMSFLGFFALVLSLIPGGFFVVDTVDASAGFSPEVADRLELANVTIYDRAGNDNMTYPYTSLIDHPEQPQYNVTGIADTYLEVWWSEEVLLGIPLAFMEFRYTTQEWWGFAFQRMVIYAANGSRVEANPPHYVNKYIDRSVLTQTWDSAINASVFSTKSPFAANYLVNFNATTYTDIGDAWDNGNLGITLTWELNRTATSISAAGLLGELLTFQAPDLGFNDTTLNLTFNALIAIPIWAMVIILIIKLITSILPTAPGVPD